jgi:RNA polymerase sigma-70 factor, ECF subfamily
VSARVLPLRKPAERDASWSDEAVAYACSSGDPAAVAELFDRFHARVTRYLSRAIGDGPDVEDLLQATFLEIARGKAEYAGRSAVSTWLLGIATNAARHYRRSAARRRDLLEAVAYAHRDAAEPTAADVAHARLALKKAQAVLKALGPDHRLAFVLCELEGVRASEAAEMLGTTESAVWKRVSDVRKAMRRALEEGGSQ